MWVSVLYLSLLASDQHKRHHAGHRKAEPKQDVTLVAGLRHIREILKLIGAVRIDKADERVIDLVILVDQINRRRIITYSAPKKKRRVDWLSTANALCISLYLSDLYRSFHNPVSREYATFKIQQQPSGLIL